MMRPSRYARRGLGDVTANAAASSAALLASGQSLPTIARTDLAAASAQGQAAIALATSSSATAARQANGAADAASLASNGFNPDDPGDEQKLMGAIAGGLALIPGAGPILGAAVELLWQLGTQVMGPALTKLFGYCSNPAGCCSSSGNWTVRQVLAASGVTSAPPAGTFAALAVPAFGQSWADAMNCKPNYAGAGYSILLPGLVAVWNAAATGPMQDVFVPYLTDRSGTLFGQSAGFAGGPPEPTNFAGPFGYPEQGPYAFLPLSQVPPWIAKPIYEGQMWTRLSVKSPPVQSRPRVSIALHVPKPTDTAAAPASSGPAPLLLAAGAAGAAGVYYVWAMRRAGRPLVPKSVRRLISPRAR